MFTYFYTEKEKKITESVYDSKMVQSTKFIYEMNTHDENMYKEQCHFQHHV